MNIARLGFAVLLVASGALILLLMSAPNHGDVPVRRVQLEGIAIEMRLEQSVAITPLPGADAGIRIDFRPGHRQPRQIDLIRSGDPCLRETCPNASRFRNGARLSFRTESNEGGSGGAEAYLTGALGFGDRKLSVLCRTQSEFGPNPEWCIHHLRNMTLIVPE